MKLDHLYPEQQREAKRLIADLRVIYDRLPHLEGLDEPRLVWARELFEIALAHKTEKLRQLGVNWQ